MLVFSLRLIHTSASSAHVAMAQPTRGCIALAVAVGIADVHLSKNTQNQNQRV